MKLFNFGYRWGVVDLADVKAGAEYLKIEGIIDGNKICIDGLSAGGFTALSALTFTDTFKAGPS